MLAAFEKLRSFFHGCDYEEALDAAEGTALLMVHRLTRGGMRTHIVALRLPN